MKKKHVHHRLKANRDCPELKVFTPCQSEAYATESKAGKRKSDPDNAVNGTDGNTRRFVMISYAVGTYGFVDDIEVFPGRNCRNRAFGFTSTAIGAGIENSVCHDYLFKMNRERKAINQRYANFRAKEKVPAP